ncbi:tetratricopeptide repeat protein [Sulfurimonas sp. HSL-1716]|uniref:O-linked N-acetylglucosamine transferase, SPINDLY family protein n=1 Tax=Hydrocurvibacter sulfurireducens TaxID=3131937 RepID=UPI0031F8421A
MSELGKMLIQANSLLKAGNHLQAAQVYQTILHYQPTNKLAKKGLKNAAKKIRPSDTPTQKEIDIAHGLYNNKQFQEALIYLADLIEKYPHEPQFYMLAGAIYADLGKFEQAVALQKQALSIDPLFTRAHNCMGIALYELGYTNEAITCYQEALKTDSHFFPALNNLAQSLKSAGKISEAVTCYEEAIKLEPNHAMLYSNLATTLELSGKLEEAIQHYKKALLHEPENQIIYSKMLFALSYSQEQSSKSYLEEARRFGQIINRQIKTSFNRWSCNEAAQKLRIGFVSGGLRRHPIGFFIESIMKQMKPLNIELIAYDSSLKTDDLTERIKPYFEKWHSISGINDKDVASMIHNDKVHILVDLDGHTEHHRLAIFAYKSAPVQISWLGYHASTGIEQIDYLLADPVSIRSEDQPNYLEKIHYIPDTRFCMTPPLGAIEVAPLPALSNGYITFGCYQKLSKINDSTLDLWGAILNALPNARLRLQNSALSDMTIQEEIKNRLHDSGVDLARVTLQPSLNYEDYLASYDKVDILLDTSPFTGATTTSEALWMGVPTLTLEGDLLVSRQGVSIMQAAGLNEWVAGDQTDYLNKAVEFASNIDALCTLRHGLRDQVKASPLYDSERFAKNLEKAFWEMWREKGIPALAAQQ